METAIKIFKNNDYYNYDVIVNNFGEVLLKVDENNYQGDTWAVVKANNKYGYVQFGWGSCSGCDALQACTNLAEVDALMKELYDNIKWFDDLTALKSWVLHHDWKLTHVGHSSDFQSFFTSLLLLKEE